MVRASVIETESPEWRSGARPSSYVRVMPQDGQQHPVGGKWTESNLLPEGTAFTARRRHQPVLSGTSRIWLRAPGLHRTVAAYETAWVPNRPARAKDAKALNSPAAAGASLQVISLSRWCVDRSQHFSCPIRADGRMLESPLLKAASPRSLQQSAREWYFPGSLPPVLRGNSLPYSRSARA